MASTTRTRLADCSEEAASTTPPCTLCAPPGLEQPAHVSTISEQDLYCIYQEFKVLQARRQLNDLDKAVWVKSPGSRTTSSFGKPNSSDPLRPPGIFVKNGSTHSSTHSLVSTAASANGDCGIVDVRDDQCDVETCAAMEKASVKGAPHGLSVKHLNTDGHLKVTWTVAAGRLREKDQQMVSPAFEIVSGCSFKLLLMPISMGEKKGQTSFKKAKGCGSVHLKLGECVRVPPTLRFCISVGGVTKEIQHDFNESIVGSMPRNDEKFDFGAAVDSASSTFLVTLEVLPRV